MQVLRQEVQHNPVPDQPPRTEAQKTSLEVQMPQKVAKILLPILFLWLWKQTIQVSPRITMFMQSKDGKKAQNLEKKQQEAQER